MSLRQNVQKCASSGVHVTAKTSHKLKPHVLVYGCVLLLSVRTHFPVNAQPLGTWVNSLSCLIHLVFKFFSFSHIIKGYIFLATPGNCRVYFGMRPGSLCFLCRLSFSWWWCWGFSSLLFPYCICYYILSCMLKLLYCPCLWANLTFVSQLKQSQVASESAEFVSFHPCIERSLDMGWFCVPVEIYLAVNTINKINTGILNTLLQTVTTWIWEGSVFLFFLP